MRAPLSSLATALLLAMLPRAEGDSAQPPRLFQWEAANLQRCKAHIEAHDPAFTPAYLKLQGDAAVALAAKPESVIDKAVTPPSGDKHDYMSLAPFFWPDPKKPNGMPYKRRDGVRNPEADDSRYSDSLRFRRMSERVETLALAWYFSGDRKYADRAELVLRTWFLDPSTAMNPNLTYGQAVKGANDGRGTGLIETRYFVEIIDSIGLLSLSGAWTPQDDAAMHRWVGRYAQWMAGSSNGRYEERQANNHATYYDAQYASLALYLGQADVARKVLEAAKKSRIAAQIAPDGSDPEELERTRSLHYSAFNLEALVELAALGKSAGVDLFDYQSPEGSSIHKALAFLLPYFDPQKKWPYKQIDKFDPGYFLQMLRQAALAYNDLPLQAAIDAVPPDEAAEDENILIYPPR